MSTTEIAFEIFIFAARLVLPLLVVLLFILSAKRLLKKTPVIPLATAEEPSVRSAEAEFVMSDSIFRRFHAAMPFCHTARTMDSR